MVRAHLHADGRAAESAEPEDAVERRENQRPDDELAERAALGDLGEEGAHKGPPRDPPAPVEDGPSGHPHRARALAVGRAGFGAVLAHAA